MHRCIWLGLDRNFFDRINGPARIEARSEQTGIIYLYRYALMTHIAYRRSCRSSSALNRWPVCIRSNSRMVKTVDVSGMVHEPLAFLAFLNWRSTRIRLDRYGACSRIGIACSLATQRSKPLIDRWFQNDANTQGKKILEWKSEIKCLELKKWDV